MRVIHVVLIMFFALTLVKSQNLIPNAGFEYKLDCPNLTNQVYKSVGWQSASKASPDYYHECGLE